MIVSIRGTVLILSYNLTAVHGNNIRFGIKFEKGMSEKYCFFFFWKYRYRVNSAGNI